MKKIKEFYKNNRLFSILFTILIICIFLICFILIKCFYLGNGKSKYGDRLENISEVDVSTKKIKKIEEEIKKDKLVENVSIKKTGRIIYIDITFDVKAELIEAQSIAQKSIENFTKEQLKYFDFNFTLKQKKSENSDGFLISGAHNKNGTGLSWNNNRVVTKEESTE